LKVISADVFRGELVLEGLQREHPALVDELADACNRIVLLDVEGQHGIGHRTVADLFVDAEHVAAPVATRGHRAFGVDRDFSATAAALEGHQRRGVGVDVACTGGDDRALQLVQRFAQPEFLLHPRAIPFVTAVQADQDVGAEPGADVGAAALRAAVQAVLQFAGRRVDGQRIGRFDFITDSLRQRAGIQREAARQGRDVLRRTRTVELRRRQRRGRSGGGLGQRRRTVSGVGHGSARPPAYRPSALAFSAS